MAKMNIPSSPDLHYAYYKNLKGLDVSCDATECDKQHSPDMVNMISDDGGNPIKRLGWRQVYSLTGRVLKIYSVNNATYFITTEGFWYTLNGTLSKLLTLKVDNVSIFTFGSITYVMLNKTYYKINNDDTAISLTEVEPYIPEIIVGQKFDGTGGTALDSINVLTPKRTISFLGDSSNKTYRLCPKNLETEYRVIIDKVEIMNSSGDFKNTTAYTKAANSIGSITYLNESGESVTGSIDAPYINFTTVHAPIVTGQDNIKITFRNVNVKDESKINGVYAGLYSKVKDQIITSKIVKAYGAVSTDRLFVVVGDNNIYYTAVNKPNYFPDDNYITVGHASKIIGLHRKSQYLVSLKESSDDESTMHLIYQNTDSDSKTYFAVKPATAGIGALSYNAFGTLVDDPVFLSSNGIYGISSYFANTETVLRNRSVRINAKLLKEDNLEKACSTVWNGYYVLCVNSHCYLMDSRTMTNNAYECYYWENIPAVTFAVDDGELWFGTDDGRICKFNTDVDNQTAYSDNGTKSDSVITGGDPISARWATALDADNYPQYFKTMNKKGTLVTLKPYSRSSVKVYYSKDGGDDIYIGRADVDVFNWKDIDFSRFLFNTTDDAKDIYTNKKIKKYKRIQLIFKNDVLYEPFGVIEVVKTYILGNFSK